VISGSFCIVFSIIITSDFGVLVYIFSMSNEHILVSSLFSMGCKSVVKCVELDVLCVG
jgi:hypothetical protein